jgi:hypothetical protein
MMVKNRLECNIDYRSYCFRYNSVTHPGDVSPASASVTAGPPDARMKDCRAGTARQCASPSERTYSAAA